MGYVGERLATRLEGVSWPVAYVALVGLYVLIHYLFVSQSSQVLALFGVFLDVGIRTGVPKGSSRSRCSSRAATSPPSRRRGEPERDLRRKRLPDAGGTVPPGLLTTSFSLLVFLVVGTPWLLFVAR